MPFHNPLPDDKTPGNKSSGLQSLVQAEKLMQIAFLLPCAALIGWGLGWLVDRGLHTTWIWLAGLIFGLISGMVSVIRMALSAGNLPKRGDK
jgi:ATP synthase protein I